MNEIDKLHQLGQSIWYDNIERRLLKNGEMERMIAAGEIRGVTSNPSIFQNAIAKSTDYDSAIQPMAWSDWDPGEIFFQLAIEDIQQTADLFLSLYQETNGGDGYVSLEVNPKLANDTEGTLTQAKELWERVNRKNLMIKIPATKEGLPAIRQAIAAGININITLIFSVSRYEEVIEAYLSGLEDRVKNNLPINNIASVASFFVSRVDTKVDSILETFLNDQKINQKQFLELRGKTAVANSRLAYELFEKVISTERFKQLASKGARIQRPLWASTSTKNQAYRDVIYVEELIGENTVNTMPPQTLDAFRDHGKAEIKIRINIVDAREIFSALDNLGIDMDDVTQALENEGVKSFEKAFVSLLETINHRKNSIQNKLPGLINVIKDRIDDLDKKQIITRIYERDASVWNENPSVSNEIPNRLGWLDAPFISLELIDEINKFRDEIVQEGFTHVLLLGMGGSSLAAEVLSLSFRGYSEGLNLSILDSTDPRQLKFAEENCPNGKTIYIVSSKSGGTTEVQAFLKYFYLQMQIFAGDEAGKYFIAITDPGTELSRQANELKFRKIFYADPSVGGRFSALTAFGLVPAALLGVEIETFLQKTKEFANTCRPGVATGRNPGLGLGVILAEAAQKGIDKLTIIAEEPYRSFGSWLEQLIAESSGKLGKGIVPIDIEPFVNIDIYSQDRIFVYLKNDGIFEQKINEIINAGHPVISYELNDPYELGLEFFRWEFATAVACAVLGVNAFDQPDVQDNKTRTKQKINEFLSFGKYNSGDPVWDNEKVTIFCNQTDLDLSDKKLNEILEIFLKLRKDGDYIAINAYLPRIPAIEKQLQDFRQLVLSRTQNATTLGFGPRFLHSTGQLHKGGPENGLFIQFVDTPDQDFEIPGMGLSFGKLLYAQALGDYEALVNRNRRIIRIELKKSNIKDLWI
ncbi:MAG: transaldolase [Chloroflexi bacterium HGW-Chloroflexi-3]|nr:MAG: transaldolase [Chloroflexi bacterium HGW-Chloroflexi-3]